MKSMSKLCSVERDRVTAAEICIDECLTIMDRHGERGELYSRLKDISQTLSNDLREADGLIKRQRRLIRIRAALIAAIPMTDEDLAVSPSPGRGGDAT
jgi:hypothetical protein